MTKPKKEDESNAIDKALTDKELIEVAKKRFELAIEAEAETRKEELDDQMFMIGEQWSLDIKNQRLQDKRPCLTINRIPQFVRQVTNDQRQNRPSIKINPVDDAADIDTAKVLQGMIRHIEYTSHADIAYDTGFEAAVKTGLGYMRLVTEYSDEMSFQQEIKIKMIRDRFSVYTDPYYLEPDGSDMEWCFIFEDMSADEYKIQFPDSDLSSMSDWQSLGDRTSNWVKKDTVRVAEYYYKVYESCDICLLSDQSVWEKADIENLKDGLPHGLRVVSERTTLKPKIKWAKINGVEKLDETVIEGKWIPVIPIIGEENLVDGKRVLSGIIRHAKDPQRMYNYYKSAETEMIALAPKAPFIGAAGQFEGFEQFWKTANNKNHAYLEYNAKGYDGQPSPPPQRSNVEPPVQAINQAAQAAGDEIKATTGIYDDTLGNQNRNTAQSGVAIQRRNTQSQTSNFHFMDNLSRSMRHLGRIALNWIPKIYDKAQAARCVGEDGEVTFEQINQVFSENGKEKSHFLEHGTYDCTVSTGPSYQTKRQEAVSSMLDLAHAMPQAMQVGLDLIVGNMDWNGSDVLAARIKRSLPPQLTADDKNKDPLPPQVTQQLNQMSQMNQALIKELDIKTKEIETKVFELQSKERIAAMEQKTALAIEVMKHDQKDAMTIFQAEQDHIDRQLAIDQQDQENQMNTNSGAGGNAATPNQSPQGAGSQAAPQGVMQ